MHFLRSGAAVCPAGWVKYKINGGGTLSIIFNSAGWTAAQDRAFVYVSISEGSPLKVSVIQKNIEANMGTRDGYTFKDIDVDRQFEILISNDPDNLGDKRAAAGIHAQSILGMLGNDCCVAGGANPHSMGYFLINTSSKKLSLSNEPCQPYCNRHRGFSAEHGKFKEGWEPRPSIEAGANGKCWMSGREGSAVCPEGWVKYKIDGGGGNLLIIYNSAGWTDLQNRAYMEVSVSKDSPLKVSVEIKNIELEMGTMNGIRFQDVDVYRQFVILISDDSNNLGTKRAFTGEYAQDILLPIVKGIPLPHTRLIAGLYDDIQGNNAKITRGASLGNVVVEINCLKNMKGSINITDLNSIPSFPTYLNKNALKNALDDNNVGKVKIGGTSAGVAIQRVWWLKHDHISSTSIWSKCEEPCIASNVRDWLRQDGFKTDDLGISRSAFEEALQSGKVVLCFVSNQHWVTVIGLQTEKVYVIYYGGLYTVPLLEFAKHVSGNLYEPTAAVAVYN